MLDATFTCKPYTVDVASCPFAVLRLAVARTSLGTVVLAANAATERTPFTGPTH